MITTTKKHMESLLKNITKCYVSKTVHAQSVENMKEISLEDLQSIMTTEAMLYGDCSVSIVINDLSDGITAIVYIS